MFLMKVLLFMSSGHLFSKNNIEDQLKNPPILILDEATSSLDSESEKHVQSAIENLMSERTVFVIAHRLSTVHNANKILVLENGKIVQEGKHDELVNIDGLYKQLHKMQFRT